MSLKNKSTAEKIAFFTALALAVVSLILIVLDTSRIWVGASKPFALLFGAILVLLAYLNRKSSKGMALFYLITGSLMLIIQIVEFFI